MKKALLLASVAVLLAPALPRRLPSPPRPLQQELHASLRLRTAPAGPVRGRPPQHSQRFRLAELQLRGVAEQDLLEQGEAVFVVLLLGVVGAAARRTQRTVVPLPGVLEISSVAPIDDARSRMPIMP